MRQPERWILYEVEEGRRYRFEKMPARLIDFVSRHSQHYHSAENWLVLVAETAVSERHLSGPDEEFMNNLFSA